MCVSEVIDISPGSLGSSLYVKVYLWWLPTQLPMSFSFF